MSAENASLPVTLTVTQEQRALQLLAAPEMDDMNFQNAVNVTFETENVKEALVIPVQISLPVSTDDPDQMRLYQGEALTETPFYLAEEQGITYVRFAVTDLDESYVLAEANPLGHIKVEGNTVTVTAQAPDGSTLYAASYDDDGKMLDVDMTTVSAGQTSYELTLTPGESIRVFLLDENKQPLCEAKAQ